MTTTNSAKAEQLRALHHTSKPLVLVNAWDVVSARIIEELGFPAIATTSAGVAWAAGFADGEQISRDQMLARVKEITQVVAVPVSADLEGGYGPTVEDAAATARGALDAGAVGLNFEDSLGNELIDAQLQCKRIAAICDVGANRGVPIVINARTDVFLAEIGDNDEWRLLEAVQRGNQYISAGADVVFVPGVTDEKTISALVAAMKGPVNILAGASAPLVERLGQLGVARVSVGSGAIGYALAQFRSAAAGLRDGGSFGWIGQRISHADTNALFNDSKARHK